MADITLMLKAVRHVSIRCFISALDLVDHEKSLRICLQLISFQLLTSFDPGEPSRGIPSYRVICCGEIDCFERIWKTEPAAWGYVRRYPGVNLSEF